MPRGERLRRDEFGPALLVRKPNGARLAARSIADWRRLILASCDARALAPRSGPVDGRLPPVDGAALAVDGAERDVRRWATRARQMRGPAFASS
jgi:hypothetical protein